MRHLPQLLVYVLLRLNPLDGAPVKTALFFAEIVTHSLKRVLYCVVSLQGQ